MEKQTIQAKEVYYNRFWSKPGAFSKEKKKPFATLPVDKAANT